MSAPTTRPWYCRDDVVDEYKTTLQDDAGTLPVIKALKVLKATSVNLGVIAIVLYGMYLGADPTILGVLGLGVLALYNGIEVGEYLALLQAAREVKAGADDDSRED